MDLPDELYSDDLYWRFRGASFILEEMQRADMRLEKATSLGIPEQRFRQIEQHVNHLGLKGLGAEKKYDELFSRYKPEPAPLTREEKYYPALKAL